MSKLDKLTEDDVVTLFFVLKDQAYNLRSPALLVGKQMFMEFKYLESDMEEVYDR